MREKQTPLKKYFFDNEKNLINKWDHYFDIYERHFKKYKGRDIVLLEIGVSHGGSLQMWSDYFGDNTQIYAIDNDPRCKEFEKNNIKIFIGSQSDQNFLVQVKDNIPKVDILIDDGGHFMSQQIISFEVLFDHIQDDGVYLCEDTHTSYWLQFGGGYKRNGTFIEYSKNLIDTLNAYHSEEKRFKVDYYTKSINSIHYYDSIFVIEKKNRSEPKNVISGKISFNNSLVSNYKPNIKPFHKNKILMYLNKILRALRLKSFIWR